MVSVNLRGGHLAVCVFYVSENETQRNEFYELTPQKVAIACVSACARIHMMLMRLSLVRAEWFTVKY